MENRSRIRAGGYNETAHSSRISPDGCTTHDRRGWPRDRTTVVGPGRRTAGHLDRHVRRKTGSRDISSNPIIDHEPWADRPRGPTAVRESRHDRTRHDDDV